MDRRKIYSSLFVLPALTIFTIFFLVPMAISFYFSLTVWGFDGFEFTGLDNFRAFFTNRNLSIAMTNTIIFAVLTMLGKLFFAFFIAIFVTSKIKTKNFLRAVVFFPTLVSGVAIGLTFSALMHPSRGLINAVIGFFGGPEVNWLGNVDLALYSVIMVDIWRGVGIATVIFVAGLQAIDRNYYEAASIDGANSWQQLRTITLPLVRPAMNTIIILAFIGGMRSFDLIWAMTGGGPGFATEVMASTIYKQFAAGFFGLSTAGNVIMLVMIAIMVLPLHRFLVRKEVD